MVFLLDDVQVGSFLRGAIPSEEAWQFDVPVYANASIPNGLHTLAIQSGRNTVNSSIILDYVVYTHESQSDESEKATVIAEAAVVSVGVTLTVVAIIYFLFICIRKRRRSRTPAWYSDNEKYQYASNSEYRASKRIVSVTRPLSRFFAQDPARVIIPPSRSSSTRHLVSVLDHPQVVVVDKEKHDSLGSSMVSISRPSSPSAYRAGALGGSSIRSSESSISSASSEKAHISRLNYQNPSNQGSDEVEFPPPIYSSKPDHGQGPLHVVNGPFFG
ncbi:hypothetical protein ONZ45_g5702 [Pleurotus djamor]|nr:hypothetical protein ONZ45_g5702 [Pleurotus djamor]